MNASNAAGQALDRRTMVLALASSAIATESYVFVGHLGTLARDLSVDVPAAGQLASIFAVTYALTGPLTARLMARFDRRTVLTTGLVLIGLLNLAASMAGSYAALMTIRCLCGLAAGLVGPMASTAAADLAGPEQRGKAIAIVLSGMTIALVVGIPIGTLIGEFGGWRGTFAYAGLLAIVSALAIRIVLPPVPGAPLASGTAARAALSAPVVVCLLLTLISYASGFIIAVYVGPLVIAICDMSATGVGAIQALGGVGSILGIVAGGYVADRRGAGPVLRLAFLVSAVSLAAFSILMLAPAPRPIAIALIAAASLVGLAALFARLPIVVTRLLAIVPVETRPVIMALHISMIFMGQGLAGAIGGAVMQIAGLAALGIVGAAIALIGAAIALPARPETEQAATAGDR